MTPLSIDLPTTGDSKILGQKIGRLLNKGDLILFSGKMGSGKSTVAHGIILEKTGCPRVGRIHRPSQFGSRYKKTRHTHECPCPCGRRRAFILETYKHLDLKVGHTDLADGRPKRHPLHEVMPDSLVGAVEGVLKDGVVLIEWPERMPNILAAAVLEITMKTTEDCSRLATLVNRTGWKTRIQTLSEELS
jgi:tRNA A37 threonylcarbamoyladenosine biosynthesis protein TsaE